MSETNPLREATTAPAILRELAGACWASAHGEAVACRDDHVPTVAQWSDYFGHAASPGWEDGRVAFGERMAECHGAIGVEGVRADAARRYAAFLARRERYQVPDGEPLILTEYDPEPWEFEIEQTHRVWVQAVTAKPDEGIRHPLAVWIREWQGNRPVPAETRPDKRILPRITGGDVHPARRRGALLAGVRDMAPGARQPDLPLWPGVPERKQVPFLDVVDAAGVPVVQRGGVSDELRLFARGMSAVPPEERARDVVPLETTVGDLLNALWPVSPNTGRRTWRVGEHWPRLRRVLLEADRYAIATGRRLWWPLKLRTMPDMPAGEVTRRLGEAIRLDVAFPPGTVSGPPVDLPDMDRLMVTAPARWRGFIASNCVAWVPGVTRLPVVNRGRKVPGRFTWARNPKAYPVLTLDDRRRYAYGFDSHKHERGKVNEVFRNLPGLVVLDEAAHDPRTGEVGFRVVPEAAADAIKRRR